MARSGGRGRLRPSPIPVSMPRTTSTFDETIVVERSPVFSLDSTDPLSILRDVTTETGTGTVTESTTGDEYVLDAPAASDVATLESADLGRYIPGFPAEVGVGLRLAPPDTDPRSAGSSVQWGAFDGDDGFLFRLSDDGLELNIVKAGTTVDSTALADATVDALDGTGPSGIDITTDPVTGDARTLDEFVAEGWVWTVRYSWYGYGEVEWALVAPRQPNAVNDFQDGGQRRNVIHRATLTGQTTIREPNLPVHVLAPSCAETYVGGRQFSIIGPSTTQERSAGDFRTAQSVAGSQAFIPLIAVRRRSDVSWAKEVRIITSDYEALTNQDLILQVFIGVDAANLTGGSWVAVRNNGESALEVNRSATAVTLTGAVPLDPFIAPGGQGSQAVAAQASTKRTALPRDALLVLCARTVGTQAATVTSAPSWLEIR